MRSLVRALDAAGVALALLAVVILVTGGVGVGALTLTRAEDVVVALAAVVGTRLLLAPAAGPRWAPVSVVAGGAVAYTLVMGSIVVTRHLAFRTHALDLGYYVQVVWSIAAGRGPRVTLPPMHAWGDHLSPVLYLVAPLAWVFPVAPMLLVVQTALFAAGAFAVFGFARGALGDARPAAALAALYLVNPSLHGINIRDVHPAAFAIPLVIAAAWAFDARRHGWCVVALVAALAGREDAAVAVVGFGVWLALARRRFTLGATIAVAAVLLLWVEIQWVVPYFRGAPYQHLHQRWARLGTSLPDILAGVVFRPWDWLGLLADGRKAVYLLALLAPLGFLPLAAPRALAAALPGLAMNLLAVDPVLFHHRTQYQAFVLPFLIVAAVEGYARLRARAAGDGTRRVLVAAFALSVMLTARTVNDLTVSRWRHGPDERAAAALLARVPPAVPVSVNERLVPHLATRAEVFVHPFGADRSEYILDRAAVTGPGPGWALVAREGGWVLLRRQIASAKRG